MATKAVLQRKELKPDFIILDVGMPGPYAIAVVGILRYALAKIRNVLLTMYAAAVLRICHASIRQA
jgi:DNA-binding NarL/FixJ family response regulator